LNLRTETEEHGVRSSALAPASAGNSFARCLPPVDSLAPAAEARRLLADASFSSEQRRYVDDVLDR
jgi:hypothetical protein